MEVHIIFPHQNIWNLLLPRQLSNAASKRLPGCTFWRLTLSTWPLSALVCSWWNPRACMNSWMMVALEKQPGAFKVTSWEPVPNDMPSWKWDSLEKGSSEKGGKFFDCWTILGPKLKWKFRIQKIDGKKF